MKPEDFAVNLAGTTFEHPIMSGAGPCKAFDGPEGVKVLAKSASAAIMVGSITMNERAINPGNVFCSDEGFSWNFYGLPNPGLDSFRKELPRMISLVHGDEVNKPLFVSVAGLKPSAFAALAAEVLEADADLVELNLSCPNTEDRCLLCFEPDFVNETLDLIEKETGPRSKISLKLSLFFDPLSLKEINPPTLRVLSKIINRSKIVKAITSANTFPAAMIEDETWKQKITAIGGSAVFGSLGGRILKRANLKQIRQLRILCPNIDIFAVGGVATGKDVLDYLRAGAKVVQVATAFLNEGIRVFDRLLKEFVDEVEKGENNDHCL